MKLSKLCEHWADHNESHKESFLKWRNIANQKGLEMVVANLDKAIEMLNNCNEFLIKAKNEIE